MQTEIRYVIPLLNARGDLTQPGYAKRLLPVYDRKKIRASAWRIKEWDYYYVGNDRFGLALTIADNGYMGLDSVSFLSFGERPYQITKSPMRWLPFGRTGLPATSGAGISEIHGKDYFLKFAVTEGCRRLTGQMADFRDGNPIAFDVTLTEEPEESIVICTPFDKPKHFYYNQKINCMKAEGCVTIGTSRYELGEDSFGTLDWGRGVWTYHNTWLWGSCSSRIDGEAFGFNIGYGFGNTEAASENAIFYKGKTHKLGRVTITIPSKGRRTLFMKPWDITSDDGRFFAMFVPLLDRAADTDFYVLKSDQHQVFGHYYGQVILDDGTELLMQGLPGFCEKVENKW